jgi:transposase-like protein
MTDAQLVCPRCKAQKPIKNGKRPYRVNRIMGTMQAYRCKKCGYQWRDMDAFIPRKVV